MLRQGRRRDQIQFNHRASFHAAHSGWAEKKKAFGMHRSGGRDGRGNNRKASGDNHFSFVRLPLPTSARSSIKSFIAGLRVRGRRQRQPEKTPSVRPGWQRSPPQQMQAGEQTRNRFSPYHHCRRRRRRRRRHTTLASALARRNPLRAKQRMGKWRTTRRGSI